MNVIDIENIWKEYRLGVIGHGTLTHDLQSWWAKFRGREDPNSQISLINDEQIHQIDGDIFWALRAINIKVSKGEVLGIIGKNGAGKSTLLKILSKVTAPTKGNIKIKGRVTSLLEVGTGFHPELTGRENIFMNGAILGMSKSETKSRFDEIVDFSGVEEFIDTPVKRYSSGMRVRLGFAVAAHLDSDILIVDEVLAVGDAEFQGKAIGKMKRISSESGRTVLFVSHNMFRIKSLCTRAVLMDGGIVKNDGSSREIVSEYIDSVSQGGIPVHSRKDREGDGLFVFQDVKFLNQYGKEENKKLICGEKVIVRLLYNSIENLKNVTVAIGFYDQDEKMLFACNSSAIGRFYDIVKGTSYIDCVINNFPVSMGKCYININAKYKNSYLDYLQRAIDFEVEPGDFYRTGTLPAMSKQTVLIDYDFL